MDFSMLNPILYISQGEASHEEIQHFDGDLNDFQSVDPHSANPSEQKMQINASVVLSIFDQPSEIGVNIESDLLKTVHQQEQVV
jgi:hypothetical protein